MCDIIESFIFGYATRQFPNRLDAAVLTIASIANQGKWISLLLGLVMLVVLYVRNKFVVVVVVVDGSAKSKTKKSAIHVELSTIVSYHSSIISSINMVVVIA